jgi:anti-sigma-K factor RskA
MEFASQDRSLLKPYLLGSLASESRQEFEQSLMVDPQAYEELEAAEDDLIDEYLAGALTAGEKAQFEENFLVTPERQQSLRFARTLRRYANQESAPAQTTTPSFFADRWSSSPTMRLAMAFAVLLIIVAGVWFYQTRTTSPLSVAALTLNLNVSNNRGDRVEAGRIKLGPQDGLLRITLNLPPNLTPASRYRGELVTTQGTHQTLETSRRDAQSVLVDIPANQLAPGEYALKLYSIGEDGSEQRVGSSFFTVER